jgi:hypothetical protein
MNDLAKLADPFGVIEKLMRSETDSTGLPVLDGIAQEKDVEISSVVDLLKNIHERRAGHSTVTVDSLRSPGDEPRARYGERSAENRAGSQREAHDRKQWPVLQQELRLLCSGGSTGGKFVVVNEKDSPGEFVFECMRPIGVSPESWSAIDISLDTDRLELAPGGHGIVSIRIVLNDYAPAADSLEFCLDIRDMAGNLVSKLWVEVSFPG